MADEANILTWSFTNWVTILLMAIIGYTLWGLGVKFYKKRAQAAA